MDPANSTPTHIESDKNKGKDVDLETGDNGGNCVAYLKRQKMEENVKIITEAVGKHLVNYLDEKYHFDGLLSQDHEPPPSSTHFLVLKISVVKSC